MNVLTAPLEYWRSGGILLLPLAIVCFGIWFYYLKARQRLLQETDRANVTVISLKDLEKNTIEHWRNDDALARQDALLDRLARDVGILRALTLVAPLTGLLGTVVGMMATFQAVAGTEGDTARQVAQGVSRALITTQAGLVVAIPGVFGQMNLRRLMSRLQERFAAIRLHAHPAVREERP